MRHPGQGLLPAGRSRDAPALRAPRISYNSARRLRRKVERLIVASLTVTVHGRDCGERRALRDIAFVHCFVYSVGED